jgi:hypothetical protein
MSRRSISSTGGILLLVVIASLTLLAECVPLRLQPLAPTANGGASRGSGGVRPGDTNVTNLVAEGDVAVGGDLTVAGECVGCGGSSTHLLYVALLTSDGNNAPIVKVLEKSPGIDVTWTRATHGLVSGLISPVVNLDQVTCFSAGTMDGNDAFTTARIWPAYPGARCMVEVMDLADGMVQGPAGDFLSNTLVEIRVYP